MTDGSLVSRPYDDAYLNAYSEEHVVYEFDMLLWSARVCASGALSAPTAADAVRLNCVLIEGFVVHLRNVIEFLYPKSLKPTDVVAADFCATDAWRPAPTPTLDAARIRANKEIAHLTSARIPGTPRGKGWDFASLSGELLPAMRLFVETALPSRLSPKVVAVFG